MVERDELMKVPVFVFADLVCVFGGARVRVEHVASPATSSRSIGLRASPKGQEFQTGQWAGCQLEDPRSLAASVWECHAASKRPPGSGQLLPKLLHALLSKA